MSAETLHALLNEGCAALDLGLSEHQRDQLVKYVQLLEKWNKVYNLTSVRDPQEMMARHIIDSLSIAPYINGQSLLDVGTGGGLPGIPLAIVDPSRPVTLLDSNSKKTRFLQQVKAELALTNVTIVHGRVEEVSLPLFAMITARAFATIDDIIALAGQHCETGGYLTLMKGVYPEEELAFSSTQFELDEVISLEVPHCDGQRHLVKLIKG